ncbi:MAG: sugar ABC transporter ATP-binding protein [Actinobacteria bacterium]|nr:sugar ABC transporter ATP-binding protein [Actinomycetota bacterium]
MSTATSPERLRFQGVCKSYGAVRALADFSLTLRPGEIHALCGHNGAGKSTVVKILAGLVRPDEGQIEIDGAEALARSPQQAQRLGVALVDQEISLIDVLSVADNLMLGSADQPFLNRRRAARSRARDLLRRVGLDSLDPARPVSSLAMGERQLVEIARALGHDAGILILDEPTATLSEAEIGHVFDAVRSVSADGTAVLFVSHRLGEVMELCHSVTVLRDGQLVRTAQTTELDRAELIQLMLGHEPERALRREPPAEEGRGSVTIRGLAIPPRVPGLDLDVRPGEIVALAGQVGCGATDVIRALAGHSSRASGEVRVDGRRLRLGSPGVARAAGLAFLSNDRKSEGLFLGRSVGDNLVATRLKEMSSGGLVLERRVEPVAGRLAASIGLEERRRSAVSELSGGNQQKVFLGRLLEQPGTRLLLLDEPTRGVDVGGRADIHDLVRSAADAGVGVLFASTELDEIFDLADTIVTMFSGRVVAVARRTETSTHRVVSEMTHAPNDREAVA